MSYNEKIKNNILEKGNSYGYPMKKEDDNKEHKTILHRGCTARFREEELITTLKACLDKKNIEYDILTDESCCGVMLFILEEYEAAQRIVNANIEKFKKHGVEKIITMCPGCFESFTKYYTKNPEFNIEVIFAMDLFTDMRIDGTGHIIHDPCHALERKEQIRTIIENVPTRRANTCCGFGVGITTGNKELARKMSEKTLGKEKVITYCPSCFHTLKKVDKEKTVDFYKLIEEKI